MQKAKLCVPPVKLMKLPTNIFSCLSKTRQQLFLIHRHICLGKIYQGSEWHHHQHEAGWTRPRHLHYWSTAIKGTLSTHGSIVLSEQNTYIPFVQYQYILKNKLPTNLLCHVCGKHCNNFYFVITFLCASLYALWGLDTRNTCMEYKIVIFMLNMHCACYFCRRWKKGC